MNSFILYVFTFLNTVAVPKTDSIPVSYPQGYFKNPLDISLLLAGNFGEPRKSHFHTGLDLKTNSEEGHKVFASAEGYISRINVSAGGYGNALYVSHPNGYVTVYGHLQQFSAKIADRLRKEQYAKESFSVDIKLPPGEITVKQGEQIALSGNSGGSGGPHLHFEIRDTLENAINPMLFGIQLRDNIKPTVSAIKFYAMDSTKFTSTDYRAKFVLKNGVYEMPLPEAIQLNAKQVGFAVNTFDKMDGTENTVGVYNMVVRDNGKTVYEYRMQRFAFTDARYVISQVDYPVFLSEGSRAFHKCYVEPGNKCPIYNNMVNAGMLDLSDGKKHTINIAISDFAGNVSKVNFTVQYSETSTLFKEKMFKYTTMLSHNLMNEFNTSEIKIKMPAGSLFDDVPVTYAVTPSADSGIYSKVHQWGNSKQFMYGWFDIAVKCDRLPEHLRDKALLAYKDINGNTSSRGGKYEEGFIASRSREFGQYYVRVDTTRPKIQPLNIVAGRNMKVYKKILVKISDNFSGIGSFDTYIDDQWVVTNYDAKTATLTHFIPETLSPGMHTFKVTVTDERNNTSEYSVKFVW